MFCNKCGNKLPENALFCSSCGARMTTETPEAQQLSAIPQSENSPLTNVQNGAKGFLIPMSIFRFMDACLWTYIIFLQFNIISTFGIYDVWSVILIVVNIGITIWTFWSAVDLLGMSILTNLTQGEIMHSINNKYYSSTARAGWFGLQLYYWSASPLLIISIIFNVVIAIIAKIALMSLSKFSKSEYIDHAGRVIQFFGGHIQIGKSLLKYDDITSIQISADKKIFFATQNGERIQLDTITNAKNLIIAVKEIVAPYVANAYITKIRQGETIKIAEVKVTKDSAVYYVNPREGPIVVTRENYGGCLFKKHLFLGGETFRVINNNNQILLRLLGDQENIIVLYCIFEELFSSKIE